MALPTLWQLLLPNFTFFTFLGVVLLIAGLIALFHPLVVKKLVPWILIISSVVFIWGFSIVQDVWASLEGKIILLGLVVVGLVFAFLFGKVVKK